MAAVWTRRDAPPARPAPQEDPSPQDQRGLDMNRYIGWSHLPPGGEIGVIESVESQGALIWLHVRLSDDKIDRRSFVPERDFLLDERGFAADAAPGEVLTTLEWFL